MINYIKTFIYFIIMIQNPQKILYIGAGCNIEPVNNFPQTKEFIFIDTQPRNEVDTHQPQFNKKLYKSKFVNNLLLSCLYNGFTLTNKIILDNKYHKKIISWKTSWFYKIPSNINPTMLVFTNDKTKQKIIYYISTNINFNMNANLKHDIESCDSFIISGYFPDINILQYFTKPKMFFGYINTNYEIDKKTNNVLYFLYNCICNRNYYFDDFYIVNDSTLDIIHCESFEDFIDTWRKL